MNATWLRPAVPGPSADPLAELARLLGVLPGYTAQDGSAHRASPEVLVAVLAALGAELDHPDGAGPALRAARAERATRVLEPVLVHWVRRPRPLTVTLPANASPRDGWLTVALEDGTVHRERLTAAIARSVGGAMHEGRHSETYQLRLGASPAFVLPPGYHQVEVEVPGVSARALLVAAPRIPVAERGVGRLHPPARPAHRRRPGGRELRRPGRAPADGRPPGVPDGRDPAPLPDIPG